MRFVDLPRTLAFRFFFGKNKVMMIALGKDKQAEYKENLFQISKVQLTNYLVPIC
jgi:predicted aldo/keto reductase-like oxidoreductase